MTGVKQLRLAFVKARAVDRESLAVLLEWGDQAKLNGMLAFSRWKSAASTRLPRGLELLANGDSTPVLEDALQRELDAYERNHMAAARIWQQAGGYAPTFGILGAVLGLIQVTGHMLDPAQLGAGIAVAFVATLYGLALANPGVSAVVREDRAQVDSELRFRRLYLDGLLAISRRGIASYRNPAGGRRARKIG